MTILTIIFVLVISYLLGSLPSGLIVVKLFTGKDVRTVESGRTGGTNAMRAAGLWAGLITAVADVLKGAASVWIAQALLPGSYQVHFIAPLLAILGHNYSIFLLDRDEGKNLRFHGGAGGAPALGGAIGLWPVSIFIILPIGLAILYFIGYASLATLSIALVTTVLFAYRAWTGAAPWEYILYGVLVGGLLLWSLRPNIVRLLQGNERLVGLRAHRKKLAEEANTSTKPLNSPH